MDFSEVVRANAPVAYRPSVKVTEDRATYKEDTYMVQLQRDRELERVLQKAFPQGILYAYLFNPYEKEDWELDVFVQIGTEYYKFNMDLQSIQTGLITLNGYAYDPKRLYDPFTSRYPNNDEYHLILRTFPGIDEIVINHLQTLPSYRLYFVTQIMQITVDK